MSAKIDWLHHESITKANYCDTCCHQYSDICGGCESLEGVPVNYENRPIDKITLREAVETGFCEDMSPVNGGERPPIGIKPRYIHDEERKQEIMDAMVRYSNAFKPIPVEWLDELRDLIDYTGAKYHD